MLKFITHYACLCCLACLYCLFFSPLVCASVNQVAIPQTTAVLSQSNPSEIIQIRNHQESVAYVQSQVVEVFINSAGEEHYEVIDKDKKADGVVALPEKFIIAPLSASNVRLLYTGNSAPDSDRYFKIRFTPIIKAQYFGAEKNSNVQSQVFVSITGSTFAVVPKVSPKPNIKITDKANAIAVSNTGDSLVLLNDCKICIGNACQIKSQKRLISGRTVLFSLSQKQIDLKTDAQFSCSTVSSTKTDFIEHTISPVN